MSMPDEGKEMEVVDTIKRWSAGGFSDSVAANYAAFSREAFWEAYHFQGAIGLYHSNVANHGGEVLEIGCGPGWLSILMQEMCARARFHLLDQSHEMLTQARRNAEERGNDRLEYHQADAAALDFPDDSFDLVVSQFMLRHLDDPAAAVREAARVVKPGGLVYFTDVLGDIEGQERSLLIERAPGPDGDRFIRSAIDSALPRATLEGFLEASGVEGWDFRVGGLGGFEFPSRQILEWVKRGFPLRDLHSDKLRNEWSREISSHWVHMYHFG